jgi:prevent-host-death family protein
MYKIELFLYILLMSELSITDARDQFPSVIASAKKKPVRITRHGKDVAVVINPSLYESLIAAPR